MPSGVNKEISREVLKILAGSQEIVEDPKVSRRFGLVYNFAYQKEGYTEGESESDAKSIEEEFSEKIRYASCLGIDPDFFFPERGASTREAKEVCRGCVVREDCLEFALETKERFGIWGGLSERERRRIRRERAIQAGLEPEEDLEDDNEPDETEDVDTNPDESGFTPTPEDFEDLRKTLGMEAISATV